MKNPLQSIFSSSANHTVCSTIAFLLSCHWLVLMLITSLLVTDTESWQSIILNWYRKCAACYRVVEIWQFSCRIQVTKSTSTHPLLLTMEELQKKKCWIVTFPHFCSHFRAFSGQNAQHCSVASWPHPLVLNRAVESFLAAGVGASPWLTDIL